MSALSWVAIPPELQKKRGTFLMVVFPEVLGRSSSPHASSSPYLRQSIRPAPGAWPPTSFMGDNSGRGSWDSYQGTLWSRGSRELPDRIWWRCWAVLTLSLCFHRWLPGSRRLRWHRNPKTGLKSQVRFSNPSFLFSGDDNGLFNQPYNMCVKKSKRYSNQGPRGPLCSPEAVVHSLPVQCRWGVQARGGTGRDNNTSRTGFLWGLNEGPVESVQQCPRHSCYFHILSLLTPPCFPCFLWLEARPLFITRMAHTLHLPSASCHRHGLGAHRSVGNPEMIWEDVATIKQEQT